MTPPAISDSSSVSSHACGVPVHILGWDEERAVWLACRDGELSFVWVPDFDDAYQATCISRGADLIVPAAIYREWVAIGEAPEERPDRPCRLPAFRLAASGGLRNSRPLMPQSGWIAGWRACCLRSS
jgi:hypothetical protein